MFSNFMDKSHSEVLSFQAKFYASEWLLSVKFERNSKCRNPARTMIGHPFNPVYLCPGVEVVPGKKSF